MDGTLIDSAPSILNSLEIALHMANVVPKLELHANLIGPSLNEILVKIVGSQSSKIAEVQRAFQDHYDQKGYQSTKPFPGIKQLLGHLKKSGRRLYIVTNKRMEPTLKILNQLEWGPYFSDTRCSDHYGTRTMLNKVEGIQLLLKENDISVKDSMYIGDRFEDFDAAKKNKISFVFAAWGYGKASRFKEHMAIMARSPKELQKIITRFV